MCRHGNQTTDLKLASPAGKPLQKQSDLRFYVGVDTEAVQPAKLKLVSRNGNCNAKAANAKQTGSFIPSAKDMMGTTT